jgi:glutathione synthase/RimK-type ligase-like ATP-grasp enzyme
MNHKIVSHWCKWRPQEREAFTDVFGKVKMTDWRESYWLDKITEEDVCFLMPSSKEFTKEMYEDLLILEKSLRTKRIINSASSMRYTFDKEANLQKWRDEGVNCPRSFGFNDRKGFYEKLEREMLEPPFLLRVTNECSGKGSILVKSKEEIPQAIDWIENFALKEATSMGMSEHSFIAVEFQDTKNVTRSDKNFSYRLIVSGDELITGYARVSLGDNWNATTADMNMPFEQVADNFVRFNSVLQAKMRDREWANTVVNAVKVLGLDIASIDAIETTSGQLSFLEVNNSWDAGYNDCLSPFYNPNKKELANFLLSNAWWFEKNMPTYWYYWLNKRLHFDKVFRSAREAMRKDGRID